MEFLNLKPLPSSLCEIESDGKTYELHNDAELYEVKYLIETQETYLIWKYPSLWFRNQPRSNFREDYFATHNITPDNTCFIALHFKDVSTFSITGKDSESFTNDDTSLSEIVADYKEGKEGLRFDFHSGMEIRVEAKEVSFLYDFKK